MAAHSVAISGKISIIATIRNADRIVVLEGQGIAEQGTHAELMARRGLYWHLNRVQDQRSPKWEVLRGQHQAVAVG